MKYVMLFALMCTLNNAMQRVAVLQMLADEKKNLTHKAIKDAVNVFRLSNKKYDTNLTSKALWGLAAAWDNSFGNNGIELAKLLINAGANPNEKLIIEEVMQAKKKDGNFYCVSVGGNYETTAFDTAHGTLKDFFESL